MIQGTCVEFCISASDSQGWTTTRTVVGLLGKQTLLAAGNRTAGLHRLWITQPPQNAKFVSALIKLKKHSPCLNNGCKSEVSVIFWRPDASDDYSTRTQMRTVLEQPHPRRISATLFYSKIHEHKCQASRHRMRQKQD